jgi:competence protein ComEC
MNRVSSFFSGLNRKWLVLSLAVAAVLVSFLAVSLPDDRLHVSFLDVGQGDAILIQKGSQQVLVDGGPSPQAVCLGLGEKMPFWDRTIELVVLSHPSADHVTGLVEVLNRYRVEQVLYPEMAFESGVYDEWLGLVEEKGIKATLAQAGQQIDLGEGVLIEVLNPPDPPLSDTDSDVDNNAAVLRLSLDEVSFLLTADIMWEAEFELLYNRTNLRSTVLKVAHHGSNTSTTPEFLAVAHPELAVISVGADNEYGHPTEEVLERLRGLVGEENIYRTDEDGTVEFITDGERLWLVTER